MGKIIIDGVEYNFGGASGSGGNVECNGDDIEVVTREEYNALVAANTVKPDTYYFISEENDPQWIYDESGKITGYKTKVGADTVFPFKKEIQSKTYSVTLTGGSASQHHSGKVDVSELGENILGYGVVGMGFSYNCYYNDVDRFNIDCSLADNKITVNLRVTANQAEDETYDANYITGSCSATVVVFYA